MNAIWPGRLLSERRQRRSAGEAKDLLAAAGAVFDSSLDHRETMRTIAQTAVPALAELCVIDLVRPDGTVGDTVVAALEPQLADSLERVRTQYKPDPQGPHPVARALRTGEAVVIEDLTDPGALERVAQSEEHRKLIASAGYRSGVVMPLFARGRLLGALSFLHVHAPRRYEPNRLSLMHDLAARAAMAIDNARLYEERTHVAGTLQRSLLPDALPRIAGMALASAYHPVGEQTEVGGDFYDVFEARSSCWLVVGDVCGKGPEAAAVTALVRHSIRALSFVWGSPARVLEAVNEVMLGHGLGGRFATVVVARLDLSERPARATIAGAGHPAPVLLDAPGSARTLALPGMLLGVREHLHAGDVEVRLEVGSTLVLYTDGLLDAGAPRRELTPQDISRLLRDAASTPTELVAELERIALSSGEGRLRDDVAIVVGQVR
ncbi:MAG: PP2C family protein-serine/threonine phosphatase [Solirubrobacteraceae bacterium]